MTELFELRPVQTKALEMMRGAVRAGKKRPQLMLPTGSGKTVIGAHMVTSATQKKVRTAFTVPLLSLVDQTFERFEQNGIPRDQMGVMQADHEWRRPDAPIQICSVQTLAKRAFPNVDLVIVDESHVQFERIYEWMDAKPDTVFVGFSATPWARGMARHYDELLIPATIKDMIRDGDLCSFKAYAPTKVDLSEVDVRCGEYVEKQVAEVMSRPKIVGDVVATWLEKAADRPTMLFAVNRAHAALLHDQFCRYGVKSAYVDSYTEREERLAVRTLFEAGEIKIICSVGTMNAGVDLPSVSCVSFCRPTKSPIFYVQAIGRGLRTHPSKDHLLILDHSGSTLDLGLPDEIGFGKLRDGDPRNKGSDPAEKRLASPRECPRCGVIVPALERQCACGWRFKHWANVDNVEGELYEIGGDTPLEQKTRRDEMTLDDKAAFYGMLKWHATVNGYKPGWAYWKYQTRMGCKPASAIDNCGLVEPSSEVLAWIARITRAWARSARR